MAKQTRKPGIGHNQPPGITMSEREASDIATVALKEVDTIARLSGTSVQRMAAAIVGHHGHMSNAIHLRFAIGEVQADGSIDYAKRGTLRAAMAKHFLRPAPKRPTIVTLDFATTDAIQKRHTALVNRGLELAGILAKNKLSLASYDRERGLWNVLPSMLVDGRTKVATAFDRLLLDGRAWLTDTPEHVVDGKQIPKAIGKVYASVDALRMTQLPKAKRADGVGAGQGKRAVVSKNDTIKGHADALIEELMAMKDGKHEYSNIKDFEENDLASLNRLVAVVSAIKSGAGFNVPRLVGKQPDAVKPVTPPAPKSDAA